MAGALLRGGLRRFPWLCNVLLYGGLFAAGDAAQQLWRRRRRGQPPDWAQTRRVALVALAFHGNFSYVWLRALERALPGRRPPAVLGKVLCDQLLGAPVAVLAFYTGEWRRHLGAAGARGLGSGARGPRSENRGAPGLGAVLGSAPRKRDCAPPQPGWGGWVPRCSPGLPGGDGCRPAPAAPAAAARGSCCAGGRLAASRGPPPRRCRRQASANAAAARRAALGAGELQALGALPGAARGGTAELRVGAAVPRRSPASGWAGPVAFN